jgi:hypothetical protein
VISIDGEINLENVIEGFLSHATVLRHGFYDSLLGDECFYGFLLFITLN